MAELRYAHEYLAQSIQSEAGTLVTMTTMSLDGWYWFPISSSNHSSTSLLLSWLLRSLRCWLKQWSVYLFPEWKSNTCALIPPLSLQRMLLGDSWGSQPTHLRTPFIPCPDAPHESKFPCLKFTSLTGGSACGKSLIKDPPLQESAVPKRQWKHCEERLGAGGFLSSQMWLSTQALLSKPSIIWPEVGAFAVQEHYSEICHSSC